MKLNLKAPYLINISDEHNFDANSYVALSLIADQKTLIERNFEWVKNSQPIKYTVNGLPLDLKPILINKSQCKIDFHINIELVDGDFQAANKIAKILLESLDLHDLYKKES